jgi:malonate transporter
MLSTLAVVLPVFALIFAGWGARKLDVLGPHAASELSRFVINLALPALLFDIVNHAEWAEIWRPGFVAAFGLGMLAVFAVALLVALRRAPLTDAALAGLNAAYANTGFIGFPLALAALGPWALAPTLAAAILTVCVLFGAGIVLMELGRQSAASPLRLALKVVVALGRNPLLVAPVLGGIAAAAGFRTEGGIDAFLKLLGAAASPCALVALGLSLAQVRTASRGDEGEVALQIGFKLILQPLATWALARFVFGLAPDLTRAAVVLAALPTGTGPFMLAELYDRDPDTTAKVVLFSTLGALLTVSVVLAVV